MEAQKSKIKTEGLQLNLFREAANRSAIVEKANRITEPEQQLLVKEQLVAIENLIRPLHDTLQRHEHLLAAWDEERQKAFRWSFAA